VGGDALKIPVVLPSGKKNPLKILIFTVLAFLLINAVSCGLKVTFPAGQISGGAESSVNSGAQSVFTNGEETEKTAVLAALGELLEKDGEITDLFVFGGIYDGYELSGGEFDIYPTREDDKYHSFAFLKETLDSVYTQSGGEFFLNFPKYGPKAVCDITGVTWFSTHYTPAFKPVPDLSTAKVLSVGEDSALVRIYSEDGVAVDMPLALTKDGYRLDECFYKAYETAKTSQAEDKDKPATAMGLGSASSLTGKCIIINIFISDAVSEWNESDVREVLSRLEKAAVFLEETAAFYGRDTTVEYTGEKNSLYLETNKTLPVDMANFVWIDSLFGDTELRTLESYIKPSAAGYDNYCAVLHINKKGRSYALAADKEYSDYKNYLAEKCVVFHTDDADYPYYDSPGVYAHEILHLFGAEDLYGSFISPDADKKLEHYFPNEIMRFVSDIDQAAVSPYTAFRIGLTDYIDDQFRFLENQRSVS